MPCKDTTSQISIVLDQNDKLLDFEYSKMTCNKEIGGNTGFREYCLGKSIETLSKLEFSDLVADLNIQDQEKQFLFFLEWISLGVALDQYQGRLTPKDDLRMTSRILIVINNKPINKYECKLLTLGFIKFNFFIIFL